MVDRRRDGCCRLRSRITVAELPDRFRRLDDSDDGDSNQFHTMLDGNGDGRVDVLFVQEIILMRTAPIYQHGGADLTFSRELGPRCMREAYEWAIWVMLLRFGVSSKWGRVQMATL